MDKSRSAKDKTGTFETLKKWAWRGTAAYLWVKLIVDYVLWSGTPVRSMEASLAGRITAYLSVVGFAPANPEFLLPILKIGWLLLITNLSVWEFIGFWFYSLLFILMFPFLPVISAQLREVKTAPARGLRKARPRRLFFLISCGLLAAWFLLYLNATSPKPIAFGVIFAGCVFTSLGLRAFQRATPVTEMDRALVRSFQTLAVTAISDKERLAPKTKASATLNLKIEQFLRWLNRVLALLLRGKRGKDRVAVYVVTEYVGFLVLLASSAVFFWGLCVRLVATHAVSLRDAMLIGASHFLPGNLTVASEPLPMWTQLGPAVTAWVLFVIFVGPASSVLLPRQEAYMNQVAKSAAIFRKATLIIKRRMAIITAAKTKLDN